MGEQKREGSGRGSRLVVLVMVAVIAWALYVVVKGIFFAPGLPAPRLTAEDLGPMDFGWRVEQLDGPQMDMAEVKGKVVLLNFWEHWCPPCVAEMPSIQRLYDVVHGEGILVLPVFRESPDATRKFLQGRGITMPVYQVVGSLPEALYPAAIPTTYIIGRDGRIAARHEGAARWDDGSVVAFLRGLAGAGPAQPPATRGQGERPAANG
jgi:thiol-disulfide isomerase/thioredoxin